MDQSKSNTAEQLAVAACDFEQQRTGHAPQAVTVVVGHDRLEITLHGQLSSVEKDLGTGPSGTAQVQAFHRQRFLSSSGPLRREIERIIGVGVREATSEVVKDTGTVVQVFLFADSVATGAGIGATGCER